MELDVLKEFGEGFVRLSLPLMLATLAAFMFSRVGVVNIAIDGQILLAAAIYVTCCHSLSVAMGMAGAVLSSVLIGMTVVYAKSTHGINDLLISLGLLYCCSGLSRVVCFLAVGNPGNALLGSSRLGELHAYVLGSVVFVTTLLALSFIRGLRLSKVVGDSEALAHLDGVHRPFWMHINSAIGCLLIAVAAICLAEHGGAYTKQLSGQRGFLALAIVVLERVLKLPNQTKTATAPGL